MAQAVGGERLLQRLHRHLAGGHGAWWESGRCVCFRCFFGIHFFGKLPWPCRTSARPAARSRSITTGTLCAPHPPVFFMRDTDKDKKEMSSYTPTVCFSEKQQIFIKVAPDPKAEPASAFADTDKIQMRLEYCCYDRRDDEDMELDDTDDTKSEWQNFTTIFDMREQKNPNYCLFELKSERPEAGHHYLFRIFLYDKSTGVTTPPSRRSATISLMEDEEE